ncbi:hypothetical protein PV325_007043, partial [Microctonus aethiopoides]
RGAPFQPYMIVVGETFTTISEFYVFVDRLLHKVNSALSALDLSFKIDHVYPPDSEHLRMVMQHMHEFYNSTCIEILKRTYIPIGNPIRSIQLKAANAGESVYIRAPKGAIRSERVKPLFALIHL